MSAPERRGWRASLAPLGHRNYALVWWAGLISNVGTWMETVAVGDLVAVRTDQAGWTALETPIGIYRYYADVALTDCTAKWNAFAAVLPESAMTAFAARVANIIETQDGSVRLYAVNTPDGRLPGRERAPRVRSRQPIARTTASAW